MIKINKMIVSGKFKYLWLKSVNDVDLTKHCARSLIGDYSKIIHKGIKTLCDTEIDLKLSKAYYLCGVTDPFCYKDNFHLAFKESAGDVLYVNRNGIEIEIENAKEIPFSIKDVNFSLPEANKKEFLTCRNWQFANKFKRGING